MGIPKDQKSAFLPQKNAHWYFLHKRTEEWVVSTTFVQKGTKQSGQCCQRLATAQYSKKDQTCKKGLLLQAFLWNAKSELLWSWCEKYRTLRRRLTKNESILCEPTALASIYKYRIHKINRCYFCSDQATSYTINQTQYLQRNGSILKFIKNIY